MPNYLSEVQLPGGAEYKFKDTLARTIEGSMTPVDSHTWTGVSTTANTDAAGYLYFAKLHPTDYYCDWEIEYRVHATMAGISDENGRGEETSYVYFYGTRASLITYKTWNNISNTSYKSYYSHTLYRAKQAGIDTNHKGHALGLRLYSSYNPHVATYARTIQIDILYTKNCTVSWIDPMVIYADLDGTGSTNYDSRGEYSGYDQGETHTGDRNNYDRLIVSNSAFKCGSTAIASANIIVADSDGLYKHLKTGTAFDIRFPILYAGYSANANALITNAYMVYPLSINTTQAITLTQGQAVFVKGSLSGTMFTPVSTTPLTQTLPSTEDGYEYIRLGYAYSGTAYMWLEPVHPIFAYRNGVLREVGGDADSVEGHTVAESVANDSTLPTGAAVKSFVEGKGYVTTDTKNTAGSTDTSSKIFLVGATSQAANPQTYSDNEVYATNGKLSMKEAQIGGDSGPIVRYNTTTKSLDFVFS